MDCPTPALSREVMLAHIEEIVAATDLPVNADFEGGFADDPDGVAANVRAVHGDGSGWIVDRGLDRRQGHRSTISISPSRASARRARRSTRPASRRAAHRPRRMLSGRPARSRRDDPPTHRLCRAGADCLYAPGIRTPEQIAAVVKAVAPKPVNFLMSARARMLTVRDLAALGVRRISVGGALARVGLGRIPARGEADRGRGPLRPLRRRRAACRDQWLPARRREDADAMIPESEPHPVTGQPVGLPVDETPAQRPGRSRSKAATAVSNGSPSRPRVRAPAGPMPATITSGPTCRPTDRFPMPRHSCHGSQAASPWTIPIPMPSSIRPGARSASRR